MIWIVDPPFVEGNNLKYLSDSLCNWLFENKYPYNQFPSRVYPREGSGFYNNSSWMKETLNVEHIFREMRSGDTIIFVDFWNPTIQQLWIHSKLTMLNIKFVCWFHGSTFLEHDYLVKSGFFNVDGKISDAVRYAEYSWFAMCDQIWSTSRYFDSGIPQQFKNKILRVREPFDSRELMKYRTNEKRWDVVYPFRLDKDKVDLTVLFYVINNMPNRSFLVTTPSKMPLEMKHILQSIKNVTIIENCTGDLHLHTMAESKVIFSTAFQEGWGYSVLKGVAVGCIPMLPNRAVYPELYSEKYLYDGSDKDALYKLRHIFYTYNTYDFPQMPVVFGFENMQFENGILEYKEVENGRSDTRRII